jgi:hypothetical protein
MGAVWPRSSSRSGKAPDPPVLVLVAVERREIGGSEEEERGEEKAQPQQPATYLFATDADGRRRTRGGRLSLLAVLPPCQPRRLDPKPLPISRGVQINTREPERVGNGWDVEGQPNPRHRPPLDAAPSLLGCRDSGAHATSAPPPLRPEALRLVT